MAAVKAGLSGSQWLVDHGWNLKLLNQLDYGGDRTGTAADHGHSGVK